MKNALFCLLIACLAGCTTTTEIHMYKGEMKPKNEVAMIYNPEKFIQKINGKTVYKNIFSDPNNMVEMMHILPGETVINVLLYSDFEQVGLTSKWKEWKFTFSMQTRAGHAYYVYRADAGGSPGVIVRDLGGLGEDFNPPIMDYAEGWKYEGGKKHREKHQQYYEDLKSKGVPVKLTLVE